jgi:transposase
MNITCKTDTSVKARFERMKPVLNEQTRRRYAAEESLRLGHGGIVFVAEQTGVGLSTIRRGINEIKSGVPADPGRMRREGGGRRPVTEVHPLLLEWIGAIVRPHLRGNPEQSTVHVALGTQKIAAEIFRLYKVKVSHTTVRELLRGGMGLTLQSQHKAAEGRQHPDRDAQFKHIAKETQKAAESGNPALSVDTKKRSCWA